MQFLESFIHCRLGDTYLPGDFALPVSLEAADGDGPVDRIEGGQDVLEKQVGIPVFWGGVSGGRWCGFDDGEFFLSSSRAVVDL